MNLGVRYDYFNGSNPAIDLPAGSLVGPRHFDSVSDVPNWHDISPRLGVAYDLFGTGKTALKAFVGSYVLGGGPTSQNHPLNRTVTQATRTWTDSNGDFVPDCSVTDPVANGECGPLSPTDFGLPNPRATRYDPDILAGFAKRQNNWQTLAEIAHELRPGLSVTGGYYRRWFGNLTVTDNVLVTAADHDPFCVTAPVDPRFPGGGGNSICGFYDISPGRFGQISNLITFADHYGKQTQVYDGVDVTARLRLANIDIAGGMNTGRTAINSCFVVDSPQQLYNCDVSPPFLTQAKVNVVYPLPWWGLQTSAIVQSLPGPEILASYVATNAQVRESLGRNLSSGVNGTATVDLIKPGTTYADRILEGSVRVSKQVVVAGARLSLIADVYNILNGSGAVRLNTRYGPSWLVPTELQNPRYFKFGAQLNF